MQYYSTNNRLVRVSFMQATLHGQPMDKGLYFPAQIPSLPKSLLQSLKELSREDLACEVIRPYVGDTIDETSLRKIVAETIAFDIPLVPIMESVGTLELFHGPTLAFKDVGARFMSRCLSYFSQEAGRKKTVLVATSGDTGGAVADAFSGVENIDVVILYPSGKVSDIQERQLTCVGQNITALEVDGDFDDCQRMVKEAFADEELNRQKGLTSANSINIARWLPQQFFYFFASQQWKEDQPPVVAVPSGNFGNLCAGLLSFVSGLPAKHFIAACNANDVVYQYFQTGRLNPKPARPTLSNAMDVGAPSNFCRMLELFGNDHQAIKKVVSAATISDEETREAIQQVRQETGYVLDPHGAVGYASLQRFLHMHPDSKGYFLETAHPIKFDIGPSGDQLQQIPPAIEHLLNKEKKSIRISANSEVLKEFLLSS